MQPDAREVAQQIIDLAYHQPHINAGTELEEIHLVESIADILEEAFNEIEADLDAKAVDAEIDELETENSTLSNENDDLRQQIAILETKIEELEEAA